VTLAEAIDAPRSDVPTLREASACADCELIFRAGSACPRCGSASVMNLGEILNRRNQSETGGDAGTPQETAQC